MKGAWGRGALACALLLTAFAVAAVGSAANRSGVPTFEAFPGPAAVTYDENIAYRATFRNAGGSTFTHVIFRMKVPYAEVGSPPYQQADFVSSTCPVPHVFVDTPTGREWTCDFGKLVPGTGTAPQLVLTVVWKMPNLGSPDDCPECLKTNGRWTIKEGVSDTTDPNDAFPPGGEPVEASILSSGTGTTETLLAGGYETAAASCSASAAGNLRTHPVISLTNPVSTKFCLPNFTPPSGGPDLGYATTITETSGNARRTEVCIAKLGTNCGTGYVDENFFLTGKVVRVEIQVADAALPKGYRITQVSHNGVPMDATTCASAGDCLLSITLDKKTKIWTIVVSSGTNGFYDF